MFNVFFINLALERKATFSLYTLYNFDRKSCRKRVAKFIINEEKRGLSQYELLFFPP